MSIAYKEADETDFWLNLLHDNGYLDDIQYDSLKHDMDRILKILTSIVKTLNNKVKGSKGKHEQCPLNPEPKVDHEP